MALPTDPIMLLSVVNLNSGIISKTSMLCAKIWTPTRPICVQSCVPSATSTTHSATSLSDLS